jgi:WD40 repeat protein
VVFDFEYEKELNSLSAIAVVKGSVWDSPLNMRYKLGLERTNEIKKIEAGDLRMVSSVMHKKFPLIVTGYASGEIRLHDYEHNILLERFIHTPSRLSSSLSMPNPLTSVDIHPNNIHLVTSSLDGSYDLWDMRNLSQPMMVCENFDREYEAGSNFKFRLNEKKMVGVTSAQVYFGDLFVNKMCLFACCKLDREK